MKLEELYRQYGEYMIQKEILDARINDTKRGIAEALNKPPEKKEDA